MYMGFEYFCGANVFVTIGDMPILEVAGLSVSISENKRPIYGYASRHFNAVARGNVLVQGQLLINYIHQDYLYHAIKLGMNEVSLANDPIEFNTNFDAMSAVSNAEVGSAQAMAELQRMYWNSGGLLAATIPNRNPHDAANGINLKVVFGDEGTALNGSSGKVNYVISNLHFLGRSSVINISEDVLIESYSFIARDIIGINRPSKQVVIDDSDVLGQYREEPSPKREKTYTLAPIPTPPLLNYGGPWADIYNNTEITGFTEYSSEDKAADYYTTEGKK